MSDIYTAQCILKKRIHDARIEYLIKWKGWSSKHNSWEPIENILDRKLISNFEKKSPPSKQVTQIVSKQNFKATKQKDIPRPINTVQKSKNTRETQIQTDSCNRNEPDLSSLVNTFFTDVTVNHETFTISECKVSSEDFFESFRKASNISKNM